MDNATTLIVGLLIGMVIIGLGSIAGMSQNDPANDVSQNPDLKYTQGPQATPGVTDAPVEYNTNDNNGNSTPDISNSAPVAVEGGA